MTLEIVLKADLDRAVATLNTRLTRVEERMVTMADATQADIDQLTAQITDVSNDLGAVRDKLQAEIDALAAQGVDVTALQQAVTPLDASVNALGDLKPNPPAPAGA